MTPSEFLAARAALGLTQGALSSALGCGRRSVQYWEDGGRVIPGPVALLIRLLVAHPELLAELSET